MPKRRVRILWSPKWGPEYIKWTANFLKQNMWRVDHTLDHDDLMQESWIIFDYLVRSYPRVIEPRHFFALYKRAIINKMHDRSCAKTRHGKMQVILPEDVADYFVGRIGEVENAGYAAALIRELPEEMKLVLDHLVTGDIQPPSKRRKLQPRENLSRRICRSLGLSLDKDPIMDLKRLLTNQ